MKTKDTIKLKALVTIHHLDDDLDEHIDNEPDTTFIELFGPTLTQVKKDESLLPMYTLSNTDKYLVGERNVFDVPKKVIRYNDERANGAVTFAFRVQNLDRVMIVDGRNNYNLLFREIGELRKGLVDGKYRELCVTIANVSTVYEIVIEKNK